MERQSHPGTGLFGSHINVTYQSPWNTPPSSCPQRIKVQNTSVLTLDPLIRGKERSGMPFSTTESHPTMLISADVTRKHSCGLVARASCMSLRIWALDQRSKDRGRTRRCYSKHHIFSILGAHGDHACTIILHTKHPQTTQYICIYVFYLSRNFNSEEW